MRLTSPGGHHAATSGSDSGEANADSALSCGYRLPELGRFVGTRRPGRTVREPACRTDRGADEPALENGHGEVTLAGQDRWRSGSAPAARQRVPIGWNLLCRSRALRPAQFPTSLGAPKPWSHAAPRSLGDPRWSRLPPGGGSLHRLVSFERCGPRTSLSSNHPTSHRR